MMNTWYERKSGSLIDLTNISQIIKPSCESIDFTALDINGKQYFFSLNEYESFIADWKAIKQIQITKHDHYQVKTMETLLAQGVRDQEYIVKFSKELADKMIVEDKS